MELKLPENFMSKLECDDVYRNAPIPSSCQDDVWKIRAVRQQAIAQEQEKRTQKATLEAVLEWLESHKTETVRDEAGKIKGYRYCFNKSELSQLKEVKDG